MSGCHDKGACGMTLPLQALLVALATSGLLWAVPHTIPAFSGVAQYLTIPVITAGAADAAVGLLYYVILKGPLLHISNIPCFKTFIQARPIRATFIIIIIMMVMMINTAAAVWGIRGVIVQATHSKAAEPGHRNYGPWKPWWNFYRSIIFVLVNSGSHVASTRRIYLSGLKERFRQRQLRLTSLYLRTISDAAGVSNAALGASSGQVPAVCMASDAESAARGTTTAVDGSTTASRASATAAAPSSVDPAAQQAPHTQATPGAGTA